MRIARRGGLTLVEMLVAMAVTLIMMGSVVTIFGLVGDSISGSRATIEISERLRNARNRLQADLQGITVTMLPPRKPEEDEGYFEYIEGPASDLNPVAAETNSPPNAAWVTLLGDADDVLAMTVRSSGEPFVGQYRGSTIQSQTAEVVWFTSESTSMPVLDVTATHTATALPTALQSQPRRLKTLHRRIFLVVPSITNPPLASDDVSVSSFTGAPVANTLGSLTKRENRFAHYTASSTFPYEAILPTLGTASQFLPLSSTREGEDVILTNVLAFDVRAWDPNAPIRLSADGATALVPSDVNFDVRSETDNVARGAYVDLYFNRYLATHPTTSYFDPTSGASYFSKLPQSKSLLTIPTYDTWSAHYDALIGTYGGHTFTGNGLNGLDDNGNGVVDEPAEFDTEPPYPVPLRGIQVKIRVYEPDSRQVREVTVVQDFLPQ